MRLFGILFIPTQSFSSSTDTISDFGQVLPLLLFAAPIFSMIQAFSRGSHPTKTNTACTESHPIVEQDGGHFEIDAPGQGGDEIIAEDPANESREGLFSRQKYSQATWLNHMIVLAVAGAIVLSWVSNLAFTIDAAFPLVPSVTYLVGAEDLFTAAFNLLMFGWYLMTFAHIVILVDFAFTAGSKHSRMLNWILVGALIAYMGWLCRGLPLATDSSAMALCSLPFLYAIACIGVILYARVRRTGSVRTGGETLDLDMGIRPNAVA